MTEEELREIAAAAKILLSSIVPATDVTSLDSELGRALALPEGQAKGPLTQALRSHPDLRRWVRDHSRLTDRNRSLKATRYLLAELPDEVATGMRFSVLVKVGLDVAPGFLDRGFHIDIPEEGVSLTVNVSAPDFLVEGNRTARLHVPQKEESSLIEFTLTAVRPGRLPIWIRIFRDGTSVAELGAEVAVAEEAADSAPKPKAIEIDDFVAEPGEVTFQVEAEQGKLRFRLFSHNQDPLDESRPFANQSAAIVTQLASDLGLLAAGRSPYKGSARLESLQNTGISLWSQVPEAVADQFWELHDSISTFTVLSNTEIPWELMYPLSDKDPKGFLVEQFPVLRRVDGQSRTRRLGLAGGVRFIVPPDSPKNARTEVERIRTRLGQYVKDPEIHEWEALNALVKAPPSLLHFSCHNLYSQDAGSRISLDGGQFKPKDLGWAVMRKTLKNGATMVFLNACRTAGEVEALTRPMSWAREFMAAGAGVFVGTLWDVRSQTAADFADVFYDALVTRRLPLGKATLEARRTVSASNADGDPTSLAYTVFGSPSATIEVMPDDS